MARKKGGAAESELNMDVMMDNLTDVVGNLVIILFLLNLNVANTIKRAFDNLPPVTPQQADDLLKQRLKEQAELKVVDDKWKELDPEQKQKAEDLKLKREEIKKFQETMKANPDIKLLDFAELQKQIEARKKAKEVAKLALDKSLAEIDRLKALLEETPAPKAPPPLEVKVPNPRPMPEKPRELKILVRQDGVYFIDSTEVLSGLTAALEKERKLFAFNKGSAAFFKELFEAELNKDGKRMAECWQAVSGLGHRFQMLDLVRVWRIFDDANVAATPEVIGYTAQLATLLKRGTSGAEVAAALVGLTKGDTKLWLALDPSIDPTKPSVQVNTAGGQIQFRLLTATAKVDNKPLAIIAGLLKAGAEIYEERRRALGKRAEPGDIADVELLSKATNRALAGPQRLLPFDFSLDYLKTVPFAYLKFSPRAGAGESLETFRGLGSKYQRKLREWKDVQGGVAWFYVEAGAVPTYLEARRVADGFGVPAGWQYQTVNFFREPMRGFPVHQTALPPRAAAAGTVPPTIPVPGKKLD